MQCIVILSVHLFTAVLVIDFMNKLVRLVDCVAKKIIYFMCEQGNINQMIQHMSSEFMFEL